MYGIPFSIERLVLGGTIWMTVSLSSKWSLRVAGGNPLCVNCLSKLPLKASNKHLKTSSRAFSGNSHRGLARKQISKHATNLKESCWHENWMTKFPVCPNQWKATSWMTIGFRENKWRRNRTIEQLKHWRGRFVNNGQLERNTIGRWLSGQRDLQISSDKQFHLVLQTKIRPWLLRRRNAQMDLTRQRLGRTWERLKIIEEIDDNQWQSWRQSLTILDLQLRIWESSLINVPVNCQQSLLCPPAWIALVWQSRSTFTNPSSNTNTGTNTNTSAHIVLE